MKKTLATILTVGALLASAYAQGTLNFANSATSLVTKWSDWTDPTLINVPVGGGRVELLWAEVGTTDLNLFSSVAITTVGDVAPGRFSGGTVTIPTPVAGGPVALVVRGWTGSSMTWFDFNPSAGDMSGFTPIFNLAVTGNPTTVPSGVPASMNPAFPGLIMQGALPEPSSLALAGLGTVSLFLFRRRAGS
jgi:hypothetical protein